MDDIEEIRATMQGHLKNSVPVSLADRIALAQVDQLKRIADQLDRLVNVDSHINLEKG